MKTGGNVVLQDLTPKSASYRESMKIKTTFNKFFLKGIFIAVALMLPIACYANGPTVVIYRSASSGKPLHTRTVETSALDMQKRLVMKTILYVIDTKRGEATDSQIIGTETQVYNPDTGQLTHHSITGVAPYPVQVNATYAISPGNAKNVGEIGYHPSSSNTTIHIRTVETSKEDTQKRLIMKRILYVHDTENDGFVAFSEVIGVETQVYNPDSGQVTHLSIVGVAAYPLEANNAYIILAPGARNVSIKGNNNNVTMGGDQIPPPPALP